MNTAQKHPVLLAVLFILAEIYGTDRTNALANEPPVAEAGPSLYAAQQPLQLDGTKSYDPDNSGLLTYAWTQISGLPLVIAGAESATPTISGFVQTQQIQECEFQLIVNDGRQASPPDTVKVAIVPSFGPSTLQLENKPFDPGKPTVIYFGGSMDGVNGLAGAPWSPGPVWSDRANLIDFPGGYTPDSGYTPAGGAATRTYYKYGDMIIAYLSAVAPNYRQAIQTIGMSSGLDPALDVGLRLNETYRDARYAVNRVTELDGVMRFMEGGSTLTPSQIVSGVVAGTIARKDVNVAAGWNAFLESFQRFPASSVDGEQCWMDFYFGTLSSFLYDPPARSDILWVRTGLDHAGVYYWYMNSLTGTDMNKFNSGVVGGAYWSVIGPGKNLQLASTPGAYCFAWNGSAQNGTMGFFNQSEYPGRLPEPIALLDFHDPSFPEDDPNGLILTCEESQNTVGYQLLSGSDPYDVAHYTIAVDSNSPPAVPAAELPSSDTWWTIKARDAYGSTIHADPVRVDRMGLIAHWNLDEVEGNRAADRVGTHEGIVEGGALWQPAGGKKGGALAFDGADDYVSTDLVLNPSAGPFSVYAWVKGGAPGQVIAAQKNDMGLDCTWLGAAPSEGTLMTTLMSPQPALGSNTVITDGQWHRVGLVWDGARRHLYADGAEVARDASTVWALPSQECPVIGCGSQHTAGTFWLGLIDDVRIYNRVVQP